MTMRATVERNTAVGTDAWSGPVKPAFTPLATHPCFAWSKVSREVIDGDKTAAIEDLRIMFPLGSDVREDDEIAAITDRQDNVLMAGRFRIEGKPQRKHRHLEAALKRVA